MNALINHLIEFLFKNAGLNDAVAQIASDLIAIAIFVVATKRYKAWRWGNWKLVVIRDNQTLTTRTISVRKAEEILEEEDALSRYTKAAASPFTRLQHDVLTWPGLLQINKRTRRIIVDLDADGDGDGDVSVL